MKLTFGLALDGWLPLSGTIAPDHCYCGPAGLLRTLELRLGLPSPDESKARRLVAYQAALKAADHGQRFYSVSFAKDALGTAATLLQWRDELKEAGWLGQPLPVPRLTDLSEVEGCLAPGVATSFGDRLTAILSELDRRDPQLESVEVVEPAAYLPLQLRRVLDRLNAKYEQRGLTPAAPAGSDLANLQAALVAGSAAPLAWQNDGSVRLVCAFSEVTLANQVASHLKANRAAGVPTVVTTSLSARPLETALLACDEPSPAVGSRSPHRAILQVLPLALSLRWGPLDPKALIEFLAHPVGPVRPSLRVKLAEVVATYPGIGSAAWDEALEAYAKQQRQTHAADPKALDAALARLQRDLSDWLTPTRFDRTGGAPGVELASTCDAVARWATAQLASTQSGLLLMQYRTAAAHAMELAELLRGLPTVTAVQLELLAEQVQGSGSGSGANEAELGGVLVLKPAALLDSIDEVVWWGFEAAAIPACAPWTAAELAELKAVGAEPLAAVTRHANLNAGALRPILAARKRVTLCLPFTRGTENVGHHPLHDRLDAMIPGKLQAQVLDLEVVAGVLPTVVPAPFQPLPELRRWWKLPTGAGLPPRVLESFSSAKQFIYQPFDWALKYHAKLRKGAVAQFELVADNRQRGTLLHRVTERLFDPAAPIAWQTMLKPEFEAWLTALWPRLLETEGANLLMPGCRVDGQRLNGQAQRAVWALVEALRAANVTRVRVNFTIEKVGFFGGELGGTLDLEVENAAGERAVVDLKYGGRTSRYTELNKNLHLQLAVYGYLSAHTNGGTWPEAAYFILNPPTLLALNNTFFPTAQVVRSKVACPGMQSCWAEFEEVWNWRRDLLNRGWVELPIKNTDQTDGTGPEPNSTPPVPAWVFDTKADRYDDFTALTGWKEQQ